MKDKLLGVHPTVIVRVARILDALVALQAPAIVTAGVRSVSEQQALYAQGRTRPGRIVTNVDGVIRRSNHQIKDDGFGHAVDIAFLDDRGKPSWEEHHPWELLGAMARQQGLVWGGDWKSIVDRPHVELP